MADARPNPRSTRTPTGGAVLANVSSAPVTLLVGPHSAASLRRCTFVHIMIRVLRMGPGQESRECRQTRR